MRREVCSSVMPRFDPAFIIITSGTHLPMLSVVSTMVCLMVPVIRKLYAKSRMTKRAWIAVMEASTIDTMQTMVGMLRMLAR